MAWVCKELGHTETCCWLYLQEISYCLHIRAKVWFHTIIFGCRVRMQAVWCFNIFLLYNVQNGVTFSWLSMFIVLIYQHQDEIKNNAWGAINNDFWVTSEAICQYFFKSDEVKSGNHWQIASRVTQKSLFTVTNVLFYFLHAIFCPEHTIPLKKIIDSWFRHCRQGWSLSIVTSPQLICDITRMWGTGIVTSYLSIVLAHANWRKGDLH